MNFRVPLFIIGLFLLTLKIINALTTPGVCTTIPCLHAASKIYQYINPNVDPCDNFYEFACGTFLQNAHGNKRLQFETQLRHHNLDELLELYREEIKEDDHKVVKIAKKLYNGCFNQPQIEQNALKTLRKVFEQVGGWPLLEGSKWKEENFDWINATYKLRDLGYHSGVFVNLASTYIAEKHHHLLEVTYGDYPYEDLQAMTEIVMRFEPESKEDVLKELESAYQLSKTIEQMWMDTTFKDEVSTVEKLQEQVPAVDWLEYINHIAGPIVQLTKDDKVSVLMRYLQQLTELITRIPKRDLANLMMWKVMKAVLPYFNDHINPHIGRDVCQTRATFCALTIEDLFFPSPIEVIYNRKYLSREKKNKIEEMAKAMKTVFVEMINDAEWLTVAGKKEMLQNFNTLRIQIGLPGDYFDDKIFDYADVDLADVENGTFFDLLARAKRNFKSSEYRLVKKSEDNLPSLFHTLANSYGYHYLDNLIDIPAYITRNMVYDENIPEYINYGIMGMILGMYASEVLCIGCLDKNSAKAAELLDIKRECVRKRWGSIEMYEWDLNDVLARNITQQVAYEAYQKHVKANGEEQRLVAVDYTPNQLFWISTAFSQCRPIGIGSTTHHCKVDYAKDLNKTSVYKVNTPISWNYKFLEDFKCSETSRMKPVENCKVF
ncbi:hypothetical protein ILUMI_25961 [Ignelater luminosus]|uniref:Uncharacterized protein n=1 Tax=Ignelater luminosus TaxID=2038154 RepID=A0A8K0C7F6_IGNLU|nr:hypothetical protein ILUMI_25961 [Ignelater luminosus]